MACSGSHLVALRNNSRAEWVLKNHERQWAVTSKLSLILMLRALDIDLVLVSFSRLLYNPMLLPIQFSCPPISFSRNFTDSTWVGGPVSYPASSQATPVRPSKIYPR